MVAIYARLRNQYIFKYSTVFSARFDKQAEDGLVKDEIELNNNLGPDRKIILIILMLGFNYGIRC